MNTFAKSRKTDVCPTGSNRLAGLETTINLLLDLYIKENRVEQLPSDIGYW